MFIQTARLKHIHGKPFGKSILKKNAFSNYPQVVRHHQAFMISSHTTQKDISDHFARLLEMYLVFWLVVIHSTPFYNPALNVSSINLVFKLFQVFFRPEITQTLMLYKWMKLIIHPRQFWKK